MIVFSANPEDYTSRGNIITPLKDRIDSQILTHYPRTRESAIAITAQEAWVKRPGAAKVSTPWYFQEIVEEVAFQARRSEYIDQKSGVSTRMTIAAMENLISNVEKRALRFDQSEIVPRICDLTAMTPAMTGKLELVYEGEQEGPSTVAAALIGRSVKEIFKQYFPDAYEARENKNQQTSYYQEIVGWFENGQTVDVSDQMDDTQFYRTLDRVPGLRRIASEHMKAGSKPELAVAMEFVLEGLHQNGRLSKKSVGGVKSYQDMMGGIFDR
jgi:magnesium chelatase subunit I